MPTKSLETLKQHGIKGYHLGCTCQTCRDAMNAARQRHRATIRHRRAKDPNASYGRCCWCGDEFNTRGLTTHEDGCRL